MLQTTAVVAVAVFATLVNAMLGACVVWVAARAAQAWSVAIGQATSLSLLAAKNREQIEASRALDDEDEPLRPARVGLLDAVNDGDLIAAARRDGRRKTPREYNANENASETYREPEEVFGDESERVTL